MANRGRFEYTIGFKTDDGGLKAARKALQDLQKLTVESPGMKGLDTELAIAKTRAAELETALTRAFNVKLGTTSVSALNKQLKCLNLNQIYKDMAKIGPQGEAAFNKVAAQALKTNIQIKESNTLMTKFGQTLWNNISWMISGGIINNILGVFQQAYGYTKNLDESLNNIRIVTGQSADEMEHFAAAAQDAAKELGKGTTDYTNASLIFYQQGLGDEEVKARTDIATKIANVSGQSIETSTNEMTAVWNGYQVAANDLELYADKIAAVAASTASNTQELATGISKVASAANVSGVSIDQLNAMLSTTISVTREAPESVGTAYKTIFARIGDLVEDGTDEFGVTLGQISSHLHAMGIDILDEQGKMRDMGTVIEEVGNSWNSYSKEQQQAIAIQMAGKRQYNQLIALFDNWDKYTTALETSQNALGKLQEQQDVFMESVPAKLQQVRTSWEGVYDSVLESDSITSVADAIVGLLENVESFFDSIGGGLPIIQMLASTLLQAFSGQIGQQFGAMATNMRILTEQHNELTAKQELLIQLGNIENDEVLNEMIKKHEQVLKYKNTMTKAQQDEYNKMLDKEVEQKTLLAMLKNELEVTDQLKQKWQIQPGYDPTDLTNRINDFQQFIKRTKLGEIDLTLNIPENQNFKDTLEQVRTKYNEIWENRDLYTSLLPPEKQQQFRDNLNEVFNIIAERTNQVDAQGNPIFNLIARDENQAQQAYNSLQKVLSSIMVGAQEGEQELQRIRAADTEDLQHQIQKQQSIVSAHEQRFKLFVQRLKDQHLGQTMSQLAGAVGQAISGFNMLKNIGSIWSNDDLSKSEKMLQTIQNVAFTIPMLINSLRGLTVVTKLFSKEQAKNTIESLKNLKVKLEQDGLNLKQQVTAIRRLASEAAETGAVELETSAEGSNTAAKVANTAATGAQILVTAAHTVAILALVAALVAVGIGIYKYIQLQKEVDEANQKVIDTAKELKTKYKELIDSNNELIASFSGYYEVWKQWKEGTATVDELNNSVTNLLETLGIAGDSNVQTALSNAVETENYDRLNSLIQKREQEIRQSVLDAKQALVELEEISQKRGLMAQGKQTYDTTDSITANAAEREIEAQIGGSSDAISQSGGSISIDFSKMSSQQLEEFTADNGAWLESLRDVAFKRWQTATMDKQKELAVAEYNFYDQLIKDLFGEHSDAIQEAKVEAEKAKIGNEIFNLDIDTSQTEVFEQVKKYREKVKTELGEEISWDEAFMQASDLFPSSKETIDTVRAYVDVTTDALKDKINAYNNTHQEHLDILTEDDVVTIGQRLDEVGVNLNQLDLSKLDDDTLKKVFAEKGQMTEETIKAIKTQATAADRQIAMLNVDFESLGSSMETVGEKIEKGIAPSTLSKNKDYQSIIEQTEQLKQIYFGDEGLIDAIDTISNPNLSGTQQFADAWDKVLEKVKNADINKAFDDYKNKLDSFAKDTESLSGKVPMYLTLEAGEFIDQMDELTAADHHVDVTVDAAISSSVDKAKDDMKEIVDAASKIGENFIVGIDDLEILNEQFPGILENMTLLADGSIQLNESAVAQAKKAAEEQMKIETQEQIFKLDLQNELLRDKAEKYEEMIALAEQMASGTIDNEEVLKETLKELDKKENEIKLINQNETLIAEGKMGDDSLKNWDQYYAHLSDTDKQFWQQRLKNQQATSIEQISSITPDLSKSVFQYGAVPDYTPDGFYIGTKDRIIGIDKNNMIEVGKKIKAQYEERKKQIEEQIKKNDTLKRIVEVASESSINSLKAAGKATDKDTKATNENTDAKDKNKDSTDKQSKATEKLLDLLDDEIDAYHDINIAIQQVDTAMSHLEKQQSKLTGQALIDNLQKQNELLEKQKGNYEEKMRITQMDIELNRQFIRSAGGQFNADSTISNYFELLNAKKSYVNSLREQYNSMSAEEQEGFEVVVKQAEEDYKELQENIKNYEQLLLTDLPGLEDKIQEVTDKQIEHNIQAWELTFTVRLDTNEAEKKNREFRRKVIDQIKEDDILGNAIADYQDLSYYRNDNNTGQIQILTDELAALNKAKAEIESGSGSSIFGDNLAEVESRIKDIRSQLQQAMMDEQDAIKKIKDAYLSMIDKAKEKWDEQVEAYNKLSNLINHDMNIIKLLYGEDKAYAQLNQYYKKQNEYNQQQLDMYVKQAKSWKEMMDNKTDDPEVQKKFKENWESAIEGGKDALEKSIQGIIDAYTNAINEIFKELEDKLTNGLGFEELKNDWDFVNKESDRYLDSINGAYEISKLEREMKNKIDDNSDLVTQQKLTASMNEQLDALKQKDKLTQYDLDRANALFDIEVKKAAFKDAQQNKSKMRLRRDAQGNYSYQFVSDEDSVAQAAQELAEAQNSLYNLDKNAYKSNLDEIYEVHQEYMQKVTDLYLDQSISNEEKEKQRAKLTEDYNNVILGLTQQHEQLKINLMGSTFQSLANMYGTTIDDYKNLGIPEQNELMQQTVSIWGSGIDQLADTLGKEGLYGTMQETFEKLKDEMQEYQEQLIQVTDLAGDFFPDIAAGEDLMVSAMEDMIPVNNIIIDQWAEMIDKMQALAISAIAFADGLSEISRNAFKALEGSRLYDEYQKEKAQEEAKTNAQKKVDGAMKNSQEAKQGLDYNRDDWGDGNFPKIGDKVTYLGDYYFYDSLGTAPLGNRGEGQNKAVTVQNVAPNSPFPVAVKSNDSAYGWLKKYQIAKMDTGGYTGNWNSKEGKIGILHQKELVLNAYDTENFLEAMKIIERMLAQNTLAAQVKANLLDKELSIEEAVQQNAALISVLQLQAKQGEILKQVVNVNANFPNAKDAEEIREALEGLTNQMTQYAYSKSR